MTHPETLSINEALQLAVRRHRDGHLLEAERIYQKVLEVCPDEPNALHFLGVLSHQLGKSEEAIRLIQRSIRIAPPNAEAHNNLGNVLNELGRIQQAAEAYGKAISLDPNLADAFYNLGNVLKRTGRLEEAVSAYRKAVEINPHLSGCQIRLADTLIGLRKAGRLEEAAGVVRAWARRQPKHPGARHLLAALTGKNTPPRADDEHVRQMFDDFAREYDEKLKSLDYRAPELLGAAIDTALDAARAPCDVLDAGCGTGLCAPVVRPVARCLTGVDLSPRMVDRARRRDVYDQLFVAELTAFLAAASSRYDVIISADTLVYFGDLAPVLSAAAGALRGGGLLAFTVEDAGDEPPQIGYRLEPHGRYSHSRGYLRNALRATGFSTVSLELAVLRLEMEEPVHGLVIVARKTDEARWSS